MLSDEDSSTGLLIFSFRVWCRVEEKLGIAAGDAHSDDDSEFVSVSDVSVGCRFDCTAHSFAVVVSGVSACACAFHSVPLASHIGKVVTGRPVRLLLPFAFARLLVGAGVVALLLLLLAGVTLLLLIVCALLFVGVEVTIVAVSIAVAVVGCCPWCWRKCSRAQTVRCSFVQPSGLLFFFRFRFCRCLLCIRVFLSFSGLKNASCSSLTTYLFALCVVGEGVVQTVVDGLVAMDVEFVDVFCGWGCGKVFVHAVCTKRRLSSVCADCDMEIASLGDSISSEVSVHWCIMLARHVFLFLTSAVSWS